MKKKFVLLAGEVMKLRGARRALTVADIAKAVGDDRIPDV